VRYWKNAELAIQEYIVPAIEQCYRGKDQVQRDAAMRSCGIAAQTLILAAKDMGYDAYLESHGKVVTFCAPKLEPGTRKESIYHLSLS